MAFSGLSLSARSNHRVMRYHRSRTYVAATVDISTAAAPISINYLTTSHGSSPDPELSPPVESSGGSGAGRGVWSAGAVTGLGGGGSGDGRGVWPVGAGLGGGGVGGGLTGFSTVSKGTTGSTGASTGSFSGDAFVQQPPILLMRLLRVAWQQGAMSSIRKKFPRHIPCLVQLPDGEKLKHLLPEDSCANLVMYQSRRKCDVASTEGMFLFYGNRICMGTTRIASLDTNKPDPVMLVVRKETVFGS